MNVGTFANQSQCMLDPHEFQQRLQSTSKEPPRAHGCRRFPDYAGLKFVLSKCHKFESCMKCQRPRRRISQRASASDGPPDRIKILYAPGACLVGLASAFRGELPFQFEGQWGRYQLYRRSRLHALSSWTTSRRSEDNHRFD
jgi:hypothetical protein